MTSDDAEFGMGEHRASTAQPAPVQRITDSEICSLGAIFSTFVANDSWSFTPVQVVEFARALLAKHTPTITKDQWDQLYSLAKTRAPEQFRTEAKALLGGGV